MKRLLYILIGVFILIFIMVYPVFAVGVQPMEIKVTGKPGATVPFKFTVFSTDKTPVTMKIFLAQPIQKLNGAYDFKPVNPDASPEAKWIDLDYSPVTIPKDGQKEFAGKIKIPSKAKGYHIFAIMVEQPSAKKTESLDLSVIYAVRLEINIDSPVPKETAQVNDFEMVRGLKGEPCLQFTIKNTSITPISTSASVSIRNSLSKKLVEKVPLKPLFFWENHYEPIILPDSTVQFTGTPVEALLPGKYDIQLFFRYAASGQVLISKTVEVKANDFTYPAEKLRITRIDPGDISLIGKPGAMAMKGIKLENKSDKPVKVFLKSMEINNDYPYSIFRNMVVELKNGQEFMLEPGRVAVAILSVKSPKDAPAQGNYGLLKVITYALDGNPNPIEQSEINLEAVTLGKYTVAAEITDLISRRDNEKQLLSAVIKNTGNIKIDPKCTLYIKNKQGKSMDTVELTVQGDTDSVLPLKLITLSGITNEKLAPGNYKAEVKITQGNNVIGNSVIDLQVN